MHVRERIWLLINLLRSAVESMRDGMDALVVQSALDSLLISLDTGSASEALWLQEAEGGDDVRMRRATMIELDLLRLHAAMSSAWPSASFERPTSYFVSLDVFARHLVVNRAVAVLWRHELVRARQPVVTPTVQRARPIAVDHAPSQPPSATARASLSAHTSAFTGAQRALQLLNQQRQTTLPATAPPPPPPPPPSLNMEKIASHPVARRPRSRARVARQQQQQHQLLPPTATSNGSGVESAFDFDFRLEDADSPAYDDFSAPPSSHGEFDDFGASAMESELGDEFL
jgi:hypothetical protein